MPTKTQNLQLDTYNSAGDSQEKFLTVRTAIYGVNNSNMTKIDNWAGIVNKNIKDLSMVKPIITVNASMLSAGYYEASNLNISSYTNDLMIIFKPDTNNDGTTTLKINELDVKSLMKYEIDGTIKNLESRDLIRNHEYLFRYDGTQWIWVGAVSSDQMNIKGKNGNFTSIGANNTVIDSGVSYDDIVNDVRIMFSGMPLDGGLFEDTTPTAIHNINPKAHSCINADAMKHDIVYSSDLESHEAESNAHGNIILDGSVN